MVDPTTVAPLIRPARRHRSSRYNVAEAFGFATFWLLVLGLLYFAIMRLNGWQF